MRKVIFTESQFKTIMESYGLDTGGGYLEPGSLSMASDVAPGKEVFCDPFNPEEDDVAKVTSDLIGNNLKNGNKKYGAFRKSSSLGAPVTEDIERQTFIYSRQQKNDAANTGTKMGKNIASDPNGKSVSNGTQRKRKHDLKLKQQQMDPQTFNKVFGKIKNIVDNSLKQMSSQNAALTNNSTDKLIKANDATKTKIKTGKGHHKDGEQTNDGGIIHYSN